MSAKGFESCSDVWCDAVMFRLAMFFFVHWQYMSYSIYMIIYVVMYLCSDIHTYSLGMFAWIMTKTMRIIGILRIDFLG